ncbi:tail fiber protein [Mesorhizobium sp. dw_380]|uniref:phage tail protein n=1 Tax=Mesorhizobium sp. dw_380 TaxID=2812001 RepID=UPI00203296E3|nr:tail fiber protein [Mesorhizobium sp. dw_380]
MFAGNFAPAGWMFCEGQLLPIAENETLFQLIGTTYGGDGESTFALPDMRGRVPVHQGNGFMLAETGGVEDVQLSITQIPQHSHSVLASLNNGDASAPANNLPAQNASVQIYRAQPPALNFNAQAVTATGGSQPHSNFQPYLCVDFIISLFGLFPSPT